MPKPISTHLAELPRLNKTSLSELWEQVFTSSGGSDMRRDLMIPILAFRLQEQAVGSLSARTLARLRQLNRAMEASPQSLGHAASGLKPGTRLVREWRGQVHLATVESSGYEYRGLRYKSLSEIARLITGTRWSGPLFFGIEKAQTKSKAQERQ